MASTLVALFGPKRGVRLTVDGPILVGRSSSAALQLIDGKVSREHCRISADADGRLAIEDLGSQNGTFVNGARVDGRAALQPGDEVAIGDSLFLVDPDFAVLAARFGESTLLVSGGAGDVEDLALPPSGRAAVVPPPPGSRRSARWRPRWAPLAPSRKRSPHCSPRSTSGCIRRARSCSPETERRRRVLGGHGHAPGGPAASEAAPALSRSLLASAARARRDRAGRADRGAHAGR